MCLVVVEAAPVAATAADVPDDANGFHGLDDALEQNRGSPSSSSPPPPSTTVSDGGLSS